MSVRNFIKNKKGFTLPELLAAVVIIGILSTIAIVSVGNVMKKSHKEYDIKQNKLFTTAAQTYFTDNRSKLPKKLLTESEVTLSELIKENYIEEIVDYKKELYNQEESKAYVKKMGRGRYKYYSKLVGSDGRIITDKETSKKSEIINVKIDGYDTEETDRKEAIDNKYYVNKILKIAVSGTAEGEGISSYQYKIERAIKTTPYSSSSSKKKYKESGEIEVDKNSFSDIITIDAKDFANGEYKLVVYAYGYDGNTFNTVESKTIVIDKTKPKCIITMEGTEGLEVEGQEKTNWYKAGELKARMKITEKNKYKYTIGLEEQKDNINKDNKKTTEEYKIENNVVRKYVYGYIQDKAGNIGKCQTKKPIYYDNTNPICDITKDRTTENEGKTNDWYWNDVTLTQNSVDEEQGQNESGVRDQELLPNNSHTFPIPVPTIYTNNFTNTQNKETAGTTWYGYVRDKAGNEGICSTNIKLEKSYPKCKINYDKPRSWLNGQQTKWFNQSVKATVSFDGSPTISGMAMTKIRYKDWPDDQTSTSEINLENGTNQYVYGNLTDNAGKTVGCFDFAKVDTVNPTCTTTKNGCDPEGMSIIYDEKTYCGGFGYQYVVKCEDDQGGSGCYHLYYLSTKGATKAENKFRNDFPDIYAHGYSTAQYTVYDNAGNSAVCDIAYIYIDTQGPNIYYNKNGHIGFGNNESHNKMPRRVFCEDDDVPVDKDSFDGDFHPNGNFVEGEGSEERVDRRWKVSDKKAAMSYHYLTNGVKKTEFYCKDELGNSTRKPVDDSPIYCRCRSSKDFGCKTTNGEKKCTYKTGDIVYSENDDEINCGKEHRINGVIFNKNNTDGTGTDMYVSCSSKPLN